MLGARIEKADPKLLSKVLEGMALIALGQALLWLALRLESLVDYLLVTGVATAMVWRGFILTRRGRKKLAVSASAVLKEDPRPPVLYLRSFSGDAESESFLRSTRSPFVWTPEEQLAAVLRKIGPVVALGDPGEKEPDLGASREYVGQGWKSEVLAWMSRASLVVLRVGSDWDVRRSTGFEWEVRETLCRLAPDRVVFLITGSLAVYRTFAEWLTVLLREHVFFSGSLPEPEDRLTPLFRALPPWASWLLFFEENWAPRLVPVRASWKFKDPETPWVPRLLFAFQPVFERHDVAWEPPPPKTWDKWIERGQMVATGCGMTLLVIVLIILFLSLASSA